VLVLKCVQFLTLTAVDEFVDRSLTDAFGGLFSYPKDGESWRKMTKHGKRQFERRFCPTGKTGKSKSKQGKATKKLHSQSKLSKRLPMHVQKTVKCVQEHSKS